MHNPTREYLNHGEKMIKLDDDEKKFLRLMRRGNCSRLRQRVSSKRLRLRRGPQELKIAGSILGFHQEI